MPPPAPRTPRSFRAATGIRPALVGALLAAAFAGAPSVPIAAQGGRIEDAAQLGGRFGDVVVAGGRAWMAVGPRIVALDPDDLAGGGAVAASEPLPGIVRGLRVDGTRAVVAGDGFGLAVIDLAPAAGPPRAIGRAATGFDGRDVALDGERAVVAAADGNLVLFDLRVPALPRQLDALRLSRPDLGEHRPERVALRGERAWVVLVPTRAGVPGATLTAVDLAAQRGPASLGSLRTEGAVGDLAVAGDRAYLAETGVGLRIVDLAVDPPATLGTLPPDALTDGAPSGVAVDGRRAYLVGRSTGAGAVNATAGVAWAVDVADAAAPRVAGYGLLPLPAARAAPAGDGLLVAQPDGALSKLDVAAADGPLVAASTYVAPAVVHAAVAGGPGADGAPIVWLAGGTGGLWSAAMDPSGGLRPLGRLAAFGQVVDVAVRGTTVLAATSDPSLLLVVDGAEPEQPRLVGLLAGQGRPVRLDAPEGSSTVLIADIDEGLQMVDVASPGQPRLVLALRRAGFAWDVATDGPRGLVAAGSSGYAVLDLSIPDRPVVATSAASSGTVYGVAFAGRLGLAAALDGGLVLIDVLEPYQAGEVGRLRGGQAVDVAALGGLAFVAMADAGLRVVDVRVPSRPLLADEVDLPGWTASVSAVPEAGTPRGWILASAREAGLYAFRAEAPPLPSATPGPSATPYRTPVPTPLPTRSARPTATAVPRPIYLPAAHSSGGDQPAGLPARVVGRMPAAALGNGDLLDVAVAGDRAWVAVGMANEGAVFAVDLTGIAPRETGRAALPGWPFGLARSGDRLHAALWDRGIHVLDVSAAVPRAAESIAPPLWPLRLAASGDRVVAAGAAPEDAARHRLAVVGSSAPPVAGAFGRLAVDGAGDRAYVADAAYGLRAYAIGADGSLTAAGDLALAGAVDVALAESAPARVAVALRGDGLRAGGLAIVDAASTPRRVGLWSADDAERGLELRRVALDADGRCAWLTDLDGLAAVDLSDPARPRSVGRLRLFEPVPGLARGELLGLTVAPRRVVVLDRRGGLVVLERLPAPGGCGARAAADEP